MLDSDNVSHYDVWNCNDHLADGRLGSAIEGRCSRNTGVLCRNEAEGSSHAEAHHSHLPRSIVEGWLPVVQVAGTNPFQSGLQDLD